MPCSCPFGGNSLCLCEGGIGRVLLLLGITQIMLLIVVTFMEDVVVRHLYFIL